MEELALHRIAYLGSTRGKRKLPVRRVGAPRAVTQVEVRPALGASDFAFIKEIAIAGACMGIAPRVLVAADVSSGRLVRVLPEYEMGGAALYLIHRGERFLPPKVRAFVDHMLGELAAGGAR